MNMKMHLNVQRCGVIVDVLMVGRTVGIILSDRGGDATLCVAINIRIQSSGKKLYLDHWGRMRLVYGLLSVL